MADRLPHMTQYVCLLVSSPVDSHDFRASHTYLAKDPAERAEMIEFHETGH